MEKVIDTGRMILRAFTLDDAEAFYRLGSIPEIIRYAQSTPFASVDDAAKFMASVTFNDYETYGYGRFACVWKESGDVIGFSGVKYIPELNDSELGYRFLPQYWGKGLATEAGRASIAFARDDVGLNRLIGMVHPDNHASANVLTKLGFTVERKYQYSGLPDVDIDLFAREI